MRSCGSCGSHVRDDDACPTCGGHARVALSGAALLLGLAIGAAASAAGCQAEYGAAVTDDPYPTETADTGDGAGTGDTGDTDG